jgi:CRISPR-associated protein Cas2
MLHIVVVYDIPHHKTRRLLGELLEGYGRRVNRSVFECKLKNGDKRKMLEKEIVKLIDPHTDSVRIYPICGNCLTNATALGDEPEPFDSDGVIFF